MADIPQMTVKIADGSRVPQLTVKIAEEGDRPQMTMRVAGDGDHPQMTVKIADGSSVPQMTVILDGYAPGNAYVARVLELAPIAYYPLDEASGTTAIDVSGNGFDGTYSGATPGGAGIGDGGKSATFDGVNDTISIAAMRNAFDGNHGTILLWAKTAAWADGTVRFLAYFSAGVSLIQIVKGGSAGNLTYLRSASGTDMQVSINSGSPADYFSAALTWDIDADEVKAYKNGAQVGTTQSGGIDDFSDPPLAARTIIGANTALNTFYWSGQVAHVAIFDRALSGAEILSLGVL